MTDNVSTPPQRASAYAGVLQGERIAAEIGLMWMDGQS
jgi:hypothetical protein